MKPIDKIKDQCQGYNYNKKCGHNKVQKYKCADVLMGSRFIGFHWQIITLANELIVLGVFNNDRLYHITGIFAFVSNNFHHLVYLSFLDYFFGIIFGSK